MTNITQTLELTAFITLINSSPEKVEFEQVMTLIADNYIYTPAAFNNGEIQNAAGTNEGSCKIFAFAKLNNLTEPQTLACFGQYYREDVLNHPEADDHGNIRNFIKTGWQGINFLSTALKRC